MPIDLLSSIRKTSHWAFGTPILNSILGSSIFVAVSIALIMVLLIMFMYPAKSGTPFSIVCKMFIYMFFMTLMVVFLHDGVIKYMFEEELTDKANDDIMQGTTLMNKNIVYNNTPTVNPALTNQAKSVDGGNNGISNNNASNVNVNLNNVNLNNSQQIKPQNKPVVNYVEGGGDGMILGGYKPTLQQKNPYKW